ncbi:MAG: threonylcarbamoyl-AMP synthase [Symploca sp. SIO3C6]|uniref:Threonylcarbamoyl-AMP synthase n=1 Tax=Symploca sp. SIO1C4 TaxID=2607765 RepID=A0A6B3N903_9CYAN|nr:threonylcarbamoyl-AMP synthase [Symploca sp. SIO3C6]NER28127.1 threonylcarbamoyl-AMP synthase [Symploca sp. SIO1C4]NET08414.1 threonylcarbamoyl-AMP synthase [Symploca sp. SIO2B6]
MAIIYTVHPETPQRRRIEKIRDALQDGAVMLYPTDTVYAIGCDLNVKSAVQRVRRLKQLSNDKPLTFLCSSLSNIAQYARVSNQAYRIMKHLVPGPYTFLLPATKLVPRLVMSPKRRTSGIRVPDHQVCQELLAALGNPIISTSAHLPDEDGKTPTVGLEKAKLFDSLDALVDIIVDHGLEPGFEVSTIIDMTGDEPIIVRQGLQWETAEAWIQPAIQGRH